MAAVVNHTFDGAPVVKILHSESDALDFLELAFETPTLYEVVVTDWEFNAQDVAAAEAEAYYGTAWRRQLPPQEQQDGEEDDG